MKSQSGYSEDGNQDSSGKSSKNSLKAISTKQAKKVMNAMRRPSLFLKKEIKISESNLRYKSGV